jgi:citronellyl-CoA synthetase
MGIVDTISTIAQLPTLLKLKKGMQPRATDEKDCLGAQVEENARQFGQSSAVIFEGVKLNWSEFNALSNRFAHSFREQGLVAGDTVSVFMENRIEFLATVIALNKMGITAALINTNLTGKPLSHCISVTQSKKCIVGEERTDPLASIKDDLGLKDGEDFLFIKDHGQSATPNWAIDLSSLADEQSETNPKETGDRTLGETALYIFTSGTTGLPKAAIMSNRRYLSSAALAAVAGLQCTPQDTLYLCLPLYHTTGLLIGAGSAFHSGAGMFIRRKFSASKFLDEVRDNHCTCLVYIGELCRYLTNTNKDESDKNNPLRSMMGNGMRPDVWMDFKARFGIKRVCELYGSSEGNIAFANLLNKDCTVGMTSIEHVLVKYDVDNDEIIRDANDLCLRADEGEPGLLLGKITEDAVFEGYTDTSATEGKIIRNALEIGDSWFNTGDLMKTVDVGYTLGYPHYQFVDRIGDTFRWKSENVSTNEVGEIINAFDQIKFCNIYGVEIPNADGRAGMAAITLNDGVSELDIDRFSTFVANELPSYAIPIFLRIQKDIEVTGTFKMLKGDLRKQGYDRSQFPDPLYIMRNGEKTYSILEVDYLEKVNTGQAGY